MAKKTVRDLSPDQMSGTKVLVRVDYNVPLEDDGAVADDSRIRATLPTLEVLTTNGARTIVLSHCGRPAGVDPSLSLAPMAERLGDLIDAPVGFCGETVGDAVRTRIESLDAGEVIVLENTRFLEGESENDPGLSQQLGSLADLFVNDAFGAAHRAHASTVGAAEVIRSRGGEAVAGLLMDRELEFLGRALADPARPFVAVIGGAKISGKIDVIRSLLPSVDRILIGGAMANTFFLAMGLEVGESLAEPDRVQLARDLLDSATDRLLLPVDCVVAERVAEGAPCRIADRTAVGDAGAIVDIGPATRLMFAEEIAKAATILWNGPMGVFEMPRFAEGTRAIALAVAAATDAGALSILGGGDSAAAAEAAGVSDRLTHVSTGGGASLEFLAGARLPGVEALTDREESL